MDIGVNLSATRQLQTKVEMCWTCDAKEAADRIIKIYAYADAYINFDKRSPWWSFKSHVWNFLDF